MRPIPPKCRNGSGTPTPPHPLRPAQGETRGQSDIQGFGTEPLSTARHGIPTCTYSVFGIKCRFCGIGVYDRHAGPHGKNITRLVFPATLPELTFGPCAAGTAAMLSSLIFEICRVTGGKIESRSVLSRPESRFSFTHPDIPRPSPTDFRYTTVRVRLNDA